MNSLSPLEADDILVKTQTTPNPSALKFIVNQPLKREGKATFSSPQEAEGLPLVYDLFLIDGVSQVYLFQNTLTITHHGKLDSHDLAEQVISVLKTRMAIHHPDFQSESDNPRSHLSSQNRSHLSQELQHIEEILDRTIRPGLQADGGDIEVLGLDGHLLRVNYQGACGGCPSSMTGTLEAIQSILRQELQNENLQVVL